MRANLPQSVAPIQPTSSNVGELAPASYENVNGVKNSGIPFFENPKISKKVEKSSKKGKANDSVKVDTSNRFSVLQGLTEENQDKMFGKSEIKPQITGKKCQEDCKEECVDEVVIDTTHLSTKQKSSIKKPNRKLIRVDPPHTVAATTENLPNFSDQTDTCCCCCPTWIRVVVVGALVLPGLLLNNIGNVMVCKIAPDFGINGILPSCVKINDVISCNSNYPLWVHSKDFSKHYFKNETFGLYCPIGANNSMDKVAEAVVTSVKNGYRNKWTLTFVQKNDTNNTK
uniref:Uncharacterized protein n=1 Tax=Meloidogyne enterolobii TaxID=390850 RepID=A0A6V7VI56_MELEN|nr:unnamed protein product [Meloidogyne enterolobii]